MLNKSWLGGRRGTASLCTSVERTHSRAIYGQSRGGLGVAWYSRRVEIRMLNRMWGACVEWEASKAVESGVVHGGCGA